MINSIKSSEQNKPAALYRVKVEDKFWSKYIKLVLDEVIPYQWEILNDRIPGAEPSHAIENYRIAAGLSEGKFHGYVFQDSDVAKWLEAVAYKLTIQPDAELEKIADEVIELIGKAQQPDGYLDTYFTIEKPGYRWTDERRKHELYCAGHLIEAAVAYYEATRKRRLLDIVCRLADHISTVFGAEEGKKKGYPGHQVIEMALVKLYHVTGIESYLELAKFFIDERGRQPHFYDIEAAERGEKDHSDYFGEYTYAYTQIQEKRTDVWHRYDEQMRGLQERGFIRVPLVPTYATINGNMYFILTASLDERDKLLAYLKKNGIYAVFHYLPLHTSPYFRDKHDGRPLPNAQRFSDCLIRLPFYYGLKEKEINYICKKVEDFYTR